MYILQCYIAADVVVQTEHTIDGRLVDVKRAVPRDMAPTPSRYIILTHWPLNFPLI